MKIEMQSVLSSVKISDFKIGDLFLYANQVYMRLYSPDAPRQNRIICLETGQETIVPAGASGIPLKGTLTVERI